MAILIGVQLGVQQPAQAVDSPPNTGPEAHFPTKVPIPANKEKHGGFLPECEYIPSADVVLYAGASDWDPAAIAWGKLDVDMSALGEGISGTSSGLVYDSKRELAWVVRGYQNRGV